MQKNTVHTFNLKHFEVYYCLTCFANVVGGFLLSKKREEDRKRRK